MAKKEKREKMEKEPARRRIPGFVIFLLILVFIFGGGVAFQIIMLSMDAEIYLPPGSILENIVPAEEDRVTAELMEQFIKDAKNIESGRIAPSPSPSSSPSPSGSPEPETEIEAEPEGIAMHVFTTGSRAVESQPAVLMLGGWGTASPVLDYEPLIAQLKDRARVIVVERPGYGWSGDDYSERTLGNMLGETRSALAALGETGPYIIVAHSTAGLEAIHFAANHYDEVAGIVFIDALPPAAYAYRVDRPLDYIRALSYPIPRVTGIFRAIGLFAPQLFLSGPNVDVPSYTAMYYKNIMSPAMIEEAFMLSANAKTAMFDGVPAVPITSFVDTKAINANPELSRCWYEFNAGANVIESDVGSYIHGVNTDAVASEILKMIG